MSSVGGGQHSVTERRAPVSTGGEMRDVDSAARTASPRSSLGPGIADRVVTQDETSGVRRHQGYPVRPARRSLEPRTAELSKGFCPTAMAELSQRRDPNRCRPGSAASVKRSRNGRSPSDTDCPTIRCSRWRPSPSWPTGCRPNRSSAASGQSAVRLHRRVRRRRQGPPSQTILDIERNGVRVMLRDIHQVPAYAEVIHDCLDQVETALGGPRGRHGASRRLSVHLLARREDADALRCRAQLPAAGAGDQERPRRRLRTGSAGHAGTASASAISTASESDFAAMQTAAETFRHRVRASASICPPTFRIGSRPRRAYRSRSRSPGSPPSAGGRRACTGSTA